MTRTAYPGADDATEVLKRAQQARAASPTAMTPPASLGKPAIPPTPATAPTAPQPTGGSMSKLGSGAARTGGVAIALTNAGRMALDNQSTADRVDSAAGVAQGALAAAAPKTLVHPALVVPALANAGMGVLKGAYDNVNPNELARQAQPVPIGISDIRTPQTIAFAEKRLADSIQRPAMAPAAAAVAPGVTPATPVQPAANTAIDSLTKPIARTATGFQPPSIPAPPPRRELGPLPTLKADPGQSIFSALLGLGADMNKYREGAAVAKNEQADYKAQLEAGKFNIDALSKMAQVQTQFDDNERRNLESDMKQRVFQATQILASGKYDKKDESGLRIMAGLEKGKYTPAVVYGEVDPSTGQQAKVTVAVRDDGTVIPLRLPGEGAGAKTITKSDFQAFVKKNGYADKQAREFLEKQGFKVEG